MTGLTFAVVRSTAVRVVIAWMLFAWATRTPTAQEPAAAPYERLRAEALDRCRAIDPDATQTGLIFNPPGHRSLYLRSACVQDAAVTFRDASLCGDVRERRSPFFSSWGYSPERCLELVAAAAARDREHLEAIAARHRAQPTWLRDFSIVPSGNGRDFDIVPVFEAGAPARYLLRFDIIADDPSVAPALLHASSYHVERGVVLRMFVRLADIRSRLPGFTPGVVWRVRATMELAVGRGTTGGWWSDAFVEGVFPRRDRSQTLERTVRF